FGWSVPRTVAARACVSFRSARRAQIRRASSALASAVSASGTSRSANTLTLLASTSCTEVFLLVFLGCTPLLIVFLRHFQPFAYQIRFSLRRFHASLSLWSSYR